MRRYLSVILISFICCLLTEHFINKWQVKNKPVDGPINIRVDTLLIHDTICVIEPKIVREKEIEKIPYIDSAIIAEISRLSMENDSLSTMLRVIQREYGDSTYRAWVSGINPRLDSLKIFNKQKIITNTIEMPKPYKVKPKFSFGLQGGFGVVKPINENPNAGFYVGCGIEYNF